MIACHAELVGSLLRPRELLRAREGLAAGQIESAELRAAEDRAVDGAVALQETAGLEVVTDGEMRRLSFQSPIAEAVEGFGDHDLDAFLWGHWRGGGAGGEWDRARPPALGVVDTLKPRGFIFAKEFSYLRGRTGRIAKICLPSPSLFGNFWNPARPPPAYPSLESFLADVVQILRAEVAELARLGATYIQLDAPHYTALLEPGARRFYESLGWSAAQWLERGIEMDNAVIAAAPQVTFGFHLCRGNQGSRWLVAGDYLPIARPIFRNLRAQRLLLEYDDERSGSFAALAEIPEDKQVVLGLVTSKRGTLEPRGQLIARIRQAAAYLPLERLALSPQCGFSTSVIGNEITHGQQREKIELVVQTAGEVWG
ncbi:MAG: cobalamin-independent methionine synthase II family protein [bacterium]